jgi:hypothetical protein
MENTAATRQAGRVRRTARPSAVDVGIRVAGAGLLLGNAWIHQHLLDIGYSTVPTIGSLFRLDVALAVLAAAVVLFTPARWFPLACAAGALFQLGTIAALVQSLTIGAFGFTETLDAPLVPQAFVVEGLGAAVLLFGVYRQRRYWTAHGWSGRGWSRHGASGQHRSGDAAAR